MQKHLSLLIIAGLLTAAYTASAAAITNGLVGHWTFDETAGTTASDTSGEGHNGTVSNSLGDNPQWGPGKIGGALGFRGPDNGADVVAVADIPKPATTFSLSAWVLADPRDGTWPQSVIMESGLAGGGPFGLVIRSKNRDQAFGPLGNTTTDVTGPIDVNETVGFPTGTWQHVGLVADGAKLRLYRNGVEMASADYTTPLLPPTGPALGIGAMLDESGVASGAFWFGKIDDTGLWTNALSSAQMAAIYNAGQAGKDLTQADQFQNAPPTISAQPQSQSRFVGETAAFTVTAAGTGLTYQWKLNGQNIASATNATYSIASVQSSDAGTYLVTVTNAGGNVDSAAATLTVQAVGLTSGLAGYWKFDETAGDKAIDATTNKNDAALMNYPGDNSQWIKGQVGGALQFGGPDAEQYLIVADYPKPTTSFTASLWTWAESLPTWASWLKNWGGTDAGQFHFGLFNNLGQENIFIKQTDGKTPSASETNEFPLGTWEHVAVVCDGSNVRLYRNGAEVASTPYNGTFVSPPMQAMGIGAKLSNAGTEADSGAPGFWHGKMDDVAIWTRGLSPNEIRAIYDAGLSGKGILDAVVGPDAEPPKLTVSLSGTQLTISWPATATGFTLESADALPSATWTAVPGVQNNSVTVAVGAGNKFYRLKK